MHNIFTQQSITIIGAGPAGLSFARALAGTGLPITIVEKQPLSVLENPPYDGREIALTHLSQDIMKNLNMWDLIPPEHISLIRHAKVLDGHSLYSLDFDCEAAGTENLGFMISNHLIRKAAFESLRGFENVTILTDADVSTLSTDDQKCTVTLSDGRVLHSTLLVAADSRFSAARRMMGIPADMLDFGRVCIVCKMSHETPENDTAYECFHYDRTLAILPLNNNEVSIVITLKTQDSEGVLNMDPEDFAADIMRRTQGKFKKMKLSTDRFPYPLVATYANNFVAKRFALIGDAAVGMHPVTAHGFNLGLRGGVSLAREIETALHTGGDIGAQTLLARYNTKHQRAAWPMYTGTNALVRLYTNTSRPARFARQALLHLGNVVKPAKRLIMNQLTEINAL